LLQKAKDKNVGSIAFPSLGVGNLGYSPSLSASTICEEIIAFRNSCPESITKYYLVIFDTKVYEEFKQAVTDSILNSSLLVDNKGEVIL